MLSTTKRAVLILAGVFFFVCPVGAADWNDLANIARNIHRLVGPVVIPIDKERAAKLQQDGERLTELISRGRLDAEELAVARYYRGIIGYFVNRQVDEEGKPVDRTLATLSLADLDAFIDRGRKDYREWGVSFTIAYNVAGGIAKEHLAEPARAFFYWEKCAALGDADCIGIVAGAKRTGAYGQTIDLPQAVKDYKKVVSTGNGNGYGNGCAAASSANVIANTIYFDGANSAEGDELYWSKRAIQLGDETASHWKIAGLCNPLDLLNDEYLYRLARGQSNDQKLREALRHAEKDNKYPNSKRVAKLLTGTVGQAEFDIDVAADKSGRNRCYANFYAMWFFQLNGDPISSQKYRAKLMAIDDDHCADRKKRAKKIESLAASAGK